MGRQIAIHRKNEETGDIALLLKDVSEQVNWHGQKLTDLKSASNALLTVFEKIDKKKDKVRSYWNYKGCGMHYLDSADNKLGRPIHPFPHQPSLRKDHYKNNFPVYLAYMANK